MNIEIEIEKAKKGDKEAFTKIMHSYEQDLYKIAKTRLQKQEDIEDAFQETMLEAFRYVNRLRENSYFKSWLIKILINKCNKIYKKNKTNLIFLEEIKDEKLHTELSENELEFDSLLSSLKYEEKIIMVLYYSLDYTTKEIAKILGRNENTVKTIIKRSKEKIRKDLEVKN